MKNLHLSLPLLSQLPIQRLKQNDPPKKAAAASAASKAGGQGASSRKRTKVAAGAAGSTALLALFSFLVFMGPSPLWPGSLPAGAPMRLVSCSRQQPCR